MPVKYERGESTGIYVEGRWHGTGVVGMWKVAQMSIRAMDIDLQLAEVERRARRVLRNHRIKIKRKSGLPAQLPKSAPGILRDAAEVLYQVYFVHEWITKSHAGNAALHGLFLGSAAERMGVRPFEKWVQRGRKDYADRQRGAIKAHGTRAEKMQRWQRIQEEYDRVAARKRNLSRYRIAALVARKLRWSQHTVLRHTQDYRKSSHC